MAAAMSHTTTNVDPQEIGKFSDIAHHWWDEGGEFRPLHLLNPLRTAWVAARTPLAGAKALDVGCGGGILTEALARSAGHATGIDLAAKALEVARLHALESGLANISYREVAVETLAAEVPGTFDAVTCMEMLEHVPDPASVVRACGQLVKPGGMVFFSTLSRTVKAFLLAVVGAEYIARLLPKGTHQYERFIQPAELAAWARAAGLDVTAIEGVAYNPLTQRFALTPRPDVNYMLACRRTAA